MLVFIVNSLLVSNSSLQKTTGTLLSGEQPGNDVTFSLTKSAVQQKRTKGLYHNLALRTLFAFSSVLCPYIRAVQFVLWFQLHFIFCSSFWCLCLNCCRWCVCLSVAELCREHDERAPGLVRLRQGGAERWGERGGRGPPTTRLCAERCVSENQHLQSR